MKPLFSEFVNKQREIRDLKKEIISYQNTNMFLKSIKGFDSIPRNNKVVLILKSIINSFKFRSIRIRMLNKELDALKKERDALNLMQERKYESIFGSPPLPRQSVSYHSQGTVDWAQK